MHTQKSITSIQEFLQTLSQFIAVIDPTRVLHPSESLLLSQFLSLHSPTEYFRFSTPARRHVKSLYTHISQQTFSNRLLSLVAKGYIRRDKDKTLTISPFILSAYKIFLSTKSLALTLNLRDEILPDSSSSS